MTHRRADDRGGWVAMVLAACLRIWPADLRRRDGAAVRRTALDVVAEARRRGGMSGAWEAGAECLSVLRTGVAFRARRFGGATREVVMGWKGDIRYVARSLGGSPTFTAVAVVTLAVGIGANTAIFAVVDRVLLRSPPYDEPDRLVLIWNRLASTGDTRVAVAAPDVAVFDERATLFDGFAFTNRVSDAAIDVSDGAMHARLATVTPDFFDLLGVAAARGRVFDAGDQPGGVPPATDGPAPRPLVVSDGLWRRMFGANEEALGSTVRIDGGSATLVGVLPPGFRLELPPDAGIATDVDAWVPLSVPLSAFRRTDGRQIDQDSDNTGAALGRLSAGVTLGQAQAEMDRIAAALRAEVPQYREAGLEIDVRSLHADATAHARSTLLALQGGVGLVLLIACLNLSTLLLARGASRRSELALRMALGAGRSRIARQLLTETGAIVLLGAAAGAVVAALAVGLLVSMIPEAFAVGTDVSLDGRIVGFATAVAGGCALLVALVPVASLSATEERGVVGARLRRGRGERAQARSALVIAEVALSVVLVLGAGLLIRTVGELRNVHPGFEPAGALTFSLSARVPGRYRQASERAALMREIETGLRDLPGVEAAGLVGRLPLGGRVWTQPYGLPGQSQAEWPANRADFKMITSGYFDAIGTRLLAGRTFTRDEDLNERERIVVVDEKLAARVAPGDGALGARIGIPLDGAVIEAEIVGIVEHVRGESLESEGLDAIYVPYRQEASRDLAFVVRTTGDPAAIAPGVRDLIRAIDPQLPVYDVRTLESYVNDKLAPKRFALGLLAGFAVLALLSAGVGLYGVVAFDVGRRTRDIGVRMAIGARASDVVADVLGGGLKLAALGVASGVVLAVASARALRTLVYGVGPADPLTWAGVVASVVGVTVLACWLPARRAAALDPTVALRAE